MQYIMLFKKHAQYTSLSIENMTCSCYSSNKLLTKTKKAKTPLQLTLRQKRIVVFDGKPIAVA